MGNESLIGRGALELVRDALADTPAVFIQGPRQSGKSTLAQAADPDRAYVSLDDPIELDTAERNPAGFLARFPERVTIDEIQRAPGLFRALKAEIDRERRPGRFLLTGSAQVLLLPKLSESLAGRMEIIDLLPLSEREIAQQPGSVIDALFRGEIKDGPAFTPEALQRGGFPEPAFRAAPRRRQAWFASYLRAVVERDVRDLAEIDGKTALPRLLKLLAAQSGETLNIAALSRASGIAHTTLTRYISLLEAVFLIHQAPAWETGLGHRTIRAARCFLSDTGLQSHLTGAPGSLLTLAAAELRKQAAWSDAQPRLMHFRSIRRYECPLVLEDAAGRIVAFTLTEEPGAGPEDFQPLDFLADLAEDRFAFGYVLHTGSAAQQRDERTATLPITALWT